MFIGQLSSMESKNGRMSPRSPAGPTSIVLIQPRPHSYAKFLPSKYSGNFVGDSLAASKVYTGPPMGDSLPEPNSGTEPPSYGIHAGCAGGRSTRPVLCGLSFFGAAQSNAAPDVPVAKS